MNHEEAKNKIDSKVPEDVLFLLAIFRPCYIAGGFCRDTLLGIESHDIDLCSHYTPNEVKQICDENKMKYILTGEQHGTITLEYNNNFYEHTTFRKDKNCNGRHCEVEFSENIEDDISRRDFTINSFCWNPISQHLIYADGALDDLASGLIRAVGDPQSRFMEDALRMLRAVRFSGNLNFEIESNTFEAIQEMAGFILRVSKERIKDEIFKGLEKGNVNSFLEKMISSNLMAYIIPELCYATKIDHSKHHGEDLQEHSLLCASGIEKNSSLLRFAALLHDIGKVRCNQKVQTDIEFDSMGITVDGPQMSYRYKEETQFIGHHRESERMAEVICTDLKMSNEETEYICTLLRYHMRSVPTLKKSVKKIINAIGEKYIFDWLRLKKSDKASNLKNKKESLDKLEKDIGKFISLWRQIKREGEPMDIASLEINGRDVMAVMGIGPSKEVGSILSELYEQVLECPEMNDRYILLNVLRGIK